MKKYLVIGAGKGVGLAITIELLANGYEVVAVTRNETPELIALNTETIVLDASADDLSSLDQLSGALHGVVYCPGSILLKPFHRLGVNDFVNDYHQNVIGAVRILQKTMPLLKAANGASVVLFSSVAAQVGMPFHTSISAAKGAVEGLAKSLAAEWATLNIRVNAIAPSLTNTPLASSLLNTPEKQEAAGKRHPLQRIGTPEDMANSACFLLSDNSSWITGQILGVDGGLGKLKV
jgi:NAD(P)-dependent dehydrogenase (short-subunit alcohol dehydrogenase family)